jgi:hypothetical protein
MRLDAAAYAAGRGASALADPDARWSPTWLPFLGPFQRDVICPSIGSLVEHWISLLDAGGFSLDADTWRWFPPSALAPGA